MSDKKDIAGRLDRGFYTTTEAAKMLKVNARTIRRWIDKGYIQAKKIGGRWRIPASEVERLLSE